VRMSGGMDSLAEELSKRGVYATVSNHSEWQSLADQATSNYKARKEDPIILIGHSLGADAVMQMAAYLNRKNIPVALVVPFDGTESFSTPANVGRLVNLTQRKYAYMRPGPGFHGSLANVDVSGDPSIDHINIDKSARLHARAISEVLAVIKGHRVAGSNGAANPPPVTREETGVKVAPDGPILLSPCSVGKRPEKRSHRPVQDRARQFLDRQFGRRESTETEGLISVLHPWSVITLTARTPPQGRS
jgi:Serine hydrolase